MLGTSPSGKPSALNRHLMQLEIDNRFLIPLEEGHAVTSGWPPVTGSRPHGVTWHWTATTDLAECDRLLGGADALRRGQASAHFAIGRDRREGVHRYVSLENQSWHAGKNQLLRWDGALFDGPESKGARTTVGVEMVHIGYAREGVPAGPDWILAASPDGQRELRIHPWSEEQLEMVIEIGRRILRRWPHIGPRDHHGHHDLCPTYKLDVVAFPFARVLRALYGTDVPDVWTPLWTLRQRQLALEALGYRLGEEREQGLWGSASDHALRRFQVRTSLAVNGLWTTFVCWGLYDFARRWGLSLEELSAG